ncbi:uncharacterized protein LOC126673901 isoform X2 [Mercurialis annua]|uniref:uncharacterized protein LOC126673901 isoform X2 n=1 Tax=Mercurialis annua TaxID=3986 RepID=UPI0024ACF022|nr:uncharacterized protein LOC126673901 isoform X2 [Mercurialis annua]
MATEADINPEPLPLMESGVARHSNPAEFDYHSQTADYLVKSEAIVSTEVETTHSSFEANAGAMEDVSFSESSLIAKVLEEETKETKVSSYPKKESSAHTSENLESTIETKTSTRQDNVIDKDFDLEQQIIEKVEESSSIVATSPDIQKDGGVSSAIVNNLDEEVEVPSVTLGTEKSSNQEVGFEAVDKSAENFITTSNVASQVTNDSNDCPVEQLADETKEKDNVEKSSSLQAEESCLQESDKTEMYKVVSETCPEDDVKMSREEEQQIESVDKTPKFDIIGAEKVAEEINSEEQIHSLVTEPVEQAVSEAIAEKSKDSPPTELHEKIEISKVEIPNINEDESNGTHPVEQETVLVKEKELVNIPLETPVVTTESISKEVHGSDSKQNLDTTAAEKSIAEEIKEEASRTGSVGDNSEKYQADEVGNTSFLQETKEQIVHEAETPSKDEVERNEKAKSIAIEEHLMQFVEDSKKERTGDNIAQDTSENDQTPNETVPTPPVDRIASSEPSETNVCAQVDTGAIENSKEAFDIQEEEKPTDAVKGEEIVSENNTKSLSENLVKNSHNDDDNAGKSSTEILEKPEIDAKVDGILTEAKTSDESPDSLKDHENQQTENLTVHQASREDGSSSQKYERETDAKKDEVFINESNIKSYYQESVEPDPDKNVQNDNSTAEKPNILEKPDTANTIDDTKIVEVEEHHEVILKGEEGIEQILEKNESKEHIEQQWNVMSVETEGASSSQTDDNAVEDGREKPLCNERELEKEKDEDIISESHTERLSYEFVAENPIVEGSPVEEIHENESLIKKDDDGKEKSGLSEIEHSEVILTEGKDLEQKLQENEHEPEVKNEQALEVISAEMEAGDSTQLSNNVVEEEVEKKIEEETINESNVESLSEESVVEDPVKSFNTDDNSTEQSNTKILVDSEAARTGDNVSHETNRSKESSGVILSSSQAKEVENLQDECKNIPEESSIEDEHNTEPEILKVQGEKETLKSQEDIESAEAELPNVEHESIALEANQNNEPGEIIESLPEVIVVETKESMLRNKDTDDVILDDVTATTNTEETVDSEKKEEGYADTDASKVEKLPTSELDKETTPACLSEDTEQEPEENNEQALEVTYAEMEAGASVQLSDKAVEEEVEKKTEEGTINERNIESHSQEFVAEDPVKNLEQALQKVEEGENIEHSITGLSAEFEAGSVTALANNPEEEIDSKESELHNVEHDTEEHVEDDQSVEKGTLTNFEHEESNSEVSHKEILESRTAKTGDSIALEENQNDESTNSNEPMIQIKQDKSLQDKDIDQTETFPNEKKEDDGSSFHASEDNDSETKVAESAESSKEISNDEDNIAPELQKKEPEELVTSSDVIAAETREIVLSEKTDDHNTEKALFKGNEASCEENLETTVQKNEAEELNEILPEVINAETEASMLSNKDTDIVIPDEVIATQNSEETVDSEKKEEGYEDIDESKVEKFPTTEVDKDATPACLSEDAKQEPEEKEQALEVISAEMEAGASSQLSDSTVEEEAASNSVKDTSETVDHLIDETNKKHDNSTLEASSIGEQESMASENRSPPEASISEKIDEALNSPKPEVEDENNTEGDILKVQDEQEKLKSGEDLEQALQKVEQGGNFEQSISGQSAEFETGSFTEMANNPEKEFDSKEAALSNVEHETKEHTIDEPNIESLPKQSVEEGTCENFEHEESNAEVSQEEILESVMAKTEESIELEANQNNESTNVSRPIVGIEEDNNLQDKDTDSAETLRNEKTRDDGSIFQARKDAEVVELGTSSDVITAETREIIFSENTDDHNTEEALSKENETSCEENLETTVQKNEPEGINGETQASIVILDEVIATQNSEEIVDLGIKEEGYEDIDESKVEKFPTTEVDKDTTPACPSEDTEKHIITGEGITIDISPQTENLELTSIVEENAKQAVEVNVEKDQPTGHAMVTEDDVKEVVTNEEIQESTKNEDIEEQAIEKCHIIEDNSEVPASQVQAESSLKKEDADQNDTVQPKEEIRDHSSEVTEDIAAVGSEVAKDFDTGKDKQQPGVVLYPLKASEEENLQTESNERLVEESVTGVTEEMSFKEAVQEDKRQLESSGTDTQEKEQIMVNTEEAILNNADADGRQDNVLVESKDCETPAKADKDEEDIKHGIQNKAVIAGNDDENERIISGTPSEKISNDSPVQHSEMSPNVSELVTNEDSKPIEADSAEDTAANEIREISLISSQASEPNHTEHESTTAKKASELGFIDTEKEKTNEEAKISKTSEDEEASNIEEEALRSTESINANTKQEILEEANLTKEFESLEKEAVRENETAEIKSYGSPTEENTESAESSKKLEHTSEIMTRDVSDQIILETDQITVEEYSISESVEQNPQESQESRECTEEKIESKLEVEGQIKETQFEEVTTKDAMETQELQAEIEKGDGGEQINQSNKEEKDLKELEAVFIAEEGADKVTDSISLSTDSIEHTEIASSENPETETMVEETPIVKEKAEIEVEDEGVAKIVGLSSIEPRKDSEEVIKEQIVEDRDRGYDNEKKTSVAQVSLDSNLEEIQTDDKPDEAFNFPSVEPKESQQDIMPREEKSPNFAFQTQTDDHENEKQENVAVENADANDILQSSGTSDLVGESEFHKVEELPESEINDEIGEPSEMSHKSPDDETVAISAVAIDLTEKIANEQEKASPEMISEVQDIETKAATENLEENMQKVSTEKADSSVKSLEVDIEEDRFEEHEGEVKEEIEEASETGLEAQSHEAARKDEVADDQILQEEKYQAEPCALSLQEQELVSSTKVEKTEELLENEPKEIEEVFIQKEDSSKLQVSKLQLDNPHEAQDAIRTSVENEDKKEDSESILESTSEGQEEIKEKEIFSVQTYSAETPQEQTQTLSSAPLSSQKEDETSEKTKEMEPRELQLDTNESKEEIKEESELVSKSNSEENTTVAEYGFTSDHPLPTEKSEEQNQTSSAGLLSEKQEQGISTIAVSNEEKVIEVPEDEGNVKEEATTVNLMAEENQSEGATAATQFTRTELTKEQIKEEKVDAENRHAITIDEVETKESHEKSTGDKIVTKQIENELLYKETEKADASDTTDKQISLEEGAAKYPHQDVAQNETVKTPLPYEIRGEDVEEKSGSLNGITKFTTAREKELDVETVQKDGTTSLVEATNTIPNIQQEEKIPDGFPKTQISGESEPEKMISAVNKDIPQAMQEQLKETLQVTEAEGLQPANATNVNSGINKHEEHGADEEEENAKAAKISLFDMMQQSTRKPQEYAESTGLEEPTAAATKGESDKVKSDEEEEQHQEDGVLEGGEDEHEKNDSGSDAPVIVEASKDIDIKVPHKKSHNILSEVGSKVKHSIIKVKKAITGKSSHPKQHPPK